MKKVRSRSGACNLGGYTTIQGKIDHVKLQENGVMKTDNHGALWKIIAYYFMLSNDIYHICQHSGI